MVRSTCVRRSLAAYASADTGPRKPFHSAAAGPYAWRPQLGVPGRPRYVRPRTSAALSIASCCCVDDPGSAIRDARRVARTRGRAIRRSGLRTARVAAGPMGVDDLRRSSTSWSRVAARGSPRSASVAATASRSSPTTASSGWWPRTPATSGARSSCRCPRRSSSRSGATSWPTRARACASRPARRSPAASTRCAKTCSTCSTSSARRARARPELVRAPARSSAPSARSSRARRCRPTSRRIIYTSGTTGEPKGVRLTHRNLAATRCARAEARDYGTTRARSAFLPWAHVFGGHVELNVMMAVGGSGRDLQRRRRAVRRAAEGEADGALRGAAHLDAALPRASSATSQPSRR